MIPKIIHYCWFGQGEMPQLAKDCIDSWHRYMPNWEYRLWNEENFDVSSVAYTQEAYEARKYAFVSDYVRLWALEKFGGVYLDVDFEVFRSFETLLSYEAFAGFEGSKHCPIMMGVIASQAHGAWVNELLSYYLERHFYNPDGSLDLTTNVQFVTTRMAKQGLLQNGEEQQYEDLHIFPVDFFCPRQTTGEYLRTQNTYCEHRGLASWSNHRCGWKSYIGKLVGPQVMVRIIKLKRRILG